MTSQRLQKRPLVALCFGWFMVIIDATIVNVALPKLGREFDASVSGLQWVVDAYTVAFAGLLLSAGLLGDRLGGKRVFQCGLALFGVASAACGFSPSLPFLIGTRVVQGIGAALLVPSSLTLLQASYEDRATRARAIGIWAMVGGIASGSGPLLGGVLAQALGWRWIFFVNVPAAVVGMLLTARYVPAGQRPSGHGRVDLAGQVTGIVALVAITVGMVQAGRTGWDSPVTLAAFGVFAAAVAAFVLAESRAADPMLPLSLFRSRPLSAATVVGALMNLAFYGQLLVLTLYFQDVRKYPVLLAGFALLPQTGVIAVGSWLGGRLTSRVGPRIPMGIGMAVGAAGFFGLTSVTATRPYAAMVAPMAAAGFGISFTMPAATAAVIEGAPEGRTGIASGALNASRQVGGAIGVALLGSLVASGGTFATGFRTAMIAGGATYAAGVLLSLLVSPQTAERGSREQPARGEARQAGTARTR